MLNKRNGLQLNSYKIDTESLQSSLRQLSEMKSQLETTISYYKEHESQLVQENQRLKQEIYILQNKAQIKADHSDCQLKILKLQAELKQQKRQIERQKKILENQKRSKDAMVKQLQSKMQKQMGQSRIMADKYEQRIALLSVELKQAKISAELDQGEKKSLKEQLEASIKSLKMLESKKQFTTLNVKSDSQNQSMIQTKKDKVVLEPLSTKNEGQGNNKYQVQKITNNGMPPKSPNSNFNRQFKSSQQVRQKVVPAQDNYSHSASLINNQEQQIFSASIRKLYGEIKEMGLSAREMSVLPQFKKMKQNSNPSKKDVLNFLKNPPIEEKNENNLIRSANYLEGIIKKKHGKISGNFITEAIIARVEQYQNSSKLMTQDLQISGMTPSLSKDGLSSYGVMSEKGDHQNSHDKYYEYVNRSRPSIQDHLKIESQGSFF